MSDSYTRSEYLKIMMGSSNSKPDQVNDLGGSQSDGTDSDFANQANQNAIESSKKATESTKSSTRNGWQRTWDTLQSASDQFWQGLLDFADNIGDYAINMAIDNGWGDKTSLEGARDNDWQSQAINAIDLLSFGLYSGDSYKGENWSKLQSGTESRESLNNAYNSSFASDTPDGLRQFTDSMLQNIGNMVPSILAGVATGGASVGAQAASLGTLGVGAYTQTANKAYKESGDMGKSSFAGLADSAVEVGTELLVGPALNKIGVGTGKVMGVIGNGKSVSSTSRTFIKDLAKTINEEGMEEVVSGILDPCVESIYKGTSAFDSQEGNANRYADLSFWLTGSDSVAMQGLSGGLLGGIMGGGSLASEYKSFGTDGVNLFDTLDNAHDSIQKGDNESVAVDITKSAALMDKISKNGTVEQRRNVMEFLSNPTSSIETMTETQINDNLSSLSKEVGSMSVGSFKAYDLFRTMSNRVVSDYELEFKDDMPDGKEGYIDRKNGKIVISSKLGEKASQVLAHEYLGHAVLDSMTSAQRTRISSEIKGTKWWSDSKSELNDLYSDEKSRSESAFNDEVICKYLETWMSDNGVASGSKTSRVVSQILGYKGAAAKIINKIKDTDTHKLLSHDSIALEFTQNLQLLLKSGDFNVTMKIIRKLESGKKLSSEEQSIYDMSPEAYDYVSEAFDKSEAEIKSLLSLEISQNKSAMRFIMDEMQIFEDPDFMPSLADARREYVKDKAKNRFVKFDVGDIEYTYDFSREVIKGISYQLNRKKTFGSMALEDDYSAKGKPKKAKSSKQAKNAKSDESISDNPDLSGKKKSKEKAKPNAKPAAKRSKSTADAFIDNGKSPVEYTIIEHSSDGEFTGYIFEKRSGTNYTEFDKKTIREYLQKTGKEIPKEFKEAEPGTAEAEAMKAEDDSLENKVNLKHVQSTVKPVKETKSVEGIKVDEATEAKPLSEAKAEAKIEAEAKEDAKAEEKAEEKTAKAAEEKTSKAKAEPKVDIEENASTELKSKVDELEAKNKEQSAELRKIQHKLKFSQMNYFIAHADRYLDKSFSWTDGKTIVSAGIEEMMRSTGKAYENIHTTDDVINLLNRLNQFPEEKRAELLSKSADEIIDNGITVEGMGSVSGSDLLKLAGSDSVKSEMIKAMDSVLKNKGKMGSFKALEDKISNLRDRARDVAKAQKKYNSIKSKLSQRLPGLDSQDVLINTFFKKTLGKSPATSSGLSLKTSLVPNLMSFNDMYTEKSMSGTLFGYSEGIKSELESLKALYTADDGTFKFDKHTELSHDALEHISNFYDAVNTQYSEAREKIANQRRAVAASAVRHAEAVMKSFKPSRFSLLSKIKDSAMSLPSYIATYLGKESPLYKLVSEDWVNAESGRVSDLDGYIDKAEKIMKDNGVKAKDFNKKVSFKGNTITKSQAAAIYYTMLARPELWNESHTQFMNKIVIEGKGKSSIELSLSSTDMDDAINLLSDGEKGAVKGIFEKILNGDARNDFIKFYENAYGIAPTISDNYFSTQVEKSDTSLKTGEDATNGNVLTASGWGHAYEKTFHSKPLRVNDFFRTFNDYLEGLSYRKNFTEFLDKARSMLNTSVESNGSKTTLTRQLNQFMPDWNKGSGPSVGWKNYLTTIFTEDKSYKARDWSDAWTTRFQSSVLGLNPSSALKQFLSGPTVMGEIGIKNYMQSKPRAAYNLLHASETKQRIMDSVELFADRVKQGGAIKGELSTNAVGRISSTLMSLMGKTDELNNIVNVWSAAECTAKNERPELAYGTEGNTARAAEIFTNLLLNTQSNNISAYVSPLRSGYIGPMWRLMFGMFGADNQNKLQLVNQVTSEQMNAKSRLESYNSMENGDLKDSLISDWHKSYDSKVWKRKASGTAAGLVANAVGTILIAEIIKHLTGKKDKDQWFWGNGSDSDIGSYATSLGLEVFANWVPYVGTIASSIENNTDFSILPIDTINDLKDAAVSLSTAISGGSTDNIEKSALTLLRKIGDISGLPVSNIYKYAKGITKMASEEAYYKAFSISESFSSSTITSSFSSKVERGNMTGAVEDLSVLYSMYKTGEPNRTSLLTVAKLYESGQNDVLPKNIPDYYEDSEGNKAYLTSNQRTKFLSYYKLSNSEVSSLIGSSAYASMDDSSKAKAVKRIYDAYYEMAKYKSVGTEPSSKLGKLLSYSDSGSVDSAYKMASIIQSASSLKATSSKTRKEQIVALINKSGMGRAEKLVALALTGYSLEDSAKSTARKYLESIGMTSSQASEIIV